MKKIADILEALHAGPITPVSEAAYHGKPSAKEVYEIYNQAFLKYKRPDDNMEVPRLKWKGVEIMVWNITMQGSESRRNRAAVVSFRFDGEIEQEDVLAWTERFAKRAGVPYTNITFGAGQRGWEEMDIEPTSFTAILYEE